MKRYAAFLCAALTLMLIPAFGLLFSPEPVEWNEEAVRESIGFRAEWTTLYAELCTRLFHQTGNEQVEMGKDGFLFFAETFADYYGRSALSDESIESLAQGFLHMSRELEKRGIGFTVLIAPNKNTIYPEHMPYYMVPAGNEGNLPRLNERLVMLGVDTVDVASLLKAHKGEGLLYHPTDTHWNARGALFVYRELANRLSARYDVSMPEYEEAEWETISIQGDLVRLYRPLGTGSEFDLSPSISRAYRADAPMRSLSDSLIKTQSQANGLRAWIARDSFGEALFPYLANGIGRLVFSRELPPDMDAMEREQVMHVVFEMAERNLATLLEEATMAKLMGRR